ncbi:hypothetical protein KDX38_08365 [Pseudomonas sp. CDFA 602]|uniref:hypothetical protein n=1 Tax=Pseudomonas californiensis TaxID=2829823 RepID=UPI001E5D54E2|nr:hypothetical protein [Pseudomonas californiensis]MCD5993633.1 hypothetical protein [Pseudomonas californiensis]MCD5999228.1 hypothetical protein [Pseudomonas californiensis]
MQGKFWPDHQSAKHIECDGVCWLLDHLRDTSFQVDVPASAGQPRVLLTVNVQFSSHCVSRGPKKGEQIDFHAVGIQRMVIDHRQIRREFREDRHALSFLLPEIVRTFEDRRCFFTGKENFLTLELGAVLPGYAPDTKYEIYFNVRKEDRKNTVRLHIESAYVRDEYADNEPVNFKKEDKIKAWKLFLKRAKGEPVRGHKGNNLKLGKR